MMGSCKQQFHEERPWYEWYNTLVQSIPILTQEEYATCIASLSLPRESHEYQNARERLTTSHLREILSMAKDRPHYRLPIADYVGIGNLAVVKHFDEFVPERGAFSEFVRITVMSAVRDATNGYVRDGEASLDEVIDFGEDDLPAECREFGEALQEAFEKAKLSPLEEDIIRYRFYYQGDSPPETAQIARKLNLTVAGVNERLRRVLDRLRLLLLPWRGVSFARRSYIIMRNDNE